MFDVSLLCIFTSLLRFNTPLDPQRGRSTETLEHLAPELLHGSQLLSSQPPDVIPEWSYRAQFHLAPLTYPFIESEHLFDHQRGGPPIQQQMMEAPDEVISLIRYPDQSETHQRRLWQIKTACDVSGEKLRELFFLNCRIKIAPV